jgi:ribosomal protein S18 acetylase RimI-like enzyme
MEVREVSPEEHAQVARLTLDAYLNPAEDEHRPPISEFEEHYGPQLENIQERAAKAVVLVAVEGDDILGAVTYVPGADNDYAEFSDQDAAGIRMLAVSPAAQRRGVGRALMQACIDRARQARKRLIVLHTTQWMMPAQTMYRKLGFHRAQDRDIVTSSQMHLMGYELPL